ncbi:hypothetical protein ZWY2020_058346 [Hordeum vulgare]|nr:hypothetical protein ZWY2020_058346 [Hordeum vulgare]
MSLPLLLTPSLVPCRSTTPWAKSHVAWEPKRGAAAALLVVVFGEVCKECLCVRRAARAMRWALAVAILLLALLPAAVEASVEEGGKEACDKGWECSSSRLCYKRTIIGFFKALLPCLHRR